MTQNINTNTNALIESLSDLETTTNSYSSGGTDTDAKYW